MNNDIFAFMLPDNNDCDQGCDEELMRMKLKKLNGIVCMNKKIINFNDDSNIQNMFKS